jgi:hypothetical protein
VPRASAVRVQVVAGGHKDDPVETESALAGACGVAACRLSHDAVVVDQLAIRPAVAFVGVFRFLGRLVRLVRRILGVFRWLLGWLELLFGRRTGIAVPVVRGRYERR